MTSAVKDATPYEVWHRKKPDVGHLRVWGCVAYVHIQKDKRNQQGAHAQKCIFIGYPSETKGWKFWDPITKKAILCERADFDERYNYWGKLLRGQPPSVITPNSEPPKVTPAPVVPKEDTQVLFEPGDNNSNDSDSDDDSDSDGNAADQIQPAEEAHRDSPSPPPPIQRRRGVHHRVETPPVENNDANDLDQPLATRRHRREHKPPGEWWKLPKKPEVESSSPEPSRESTPAWEMREPEPMIKEETDEEYDDEDSVQEDALEVSEITLQPGERILEPQTFAEAMRSKYKDRWHEAAVEEITAHLSNGTWRLVPLPDGKQAIGCRWVFVVKYKADGSIERFKGRVVAKGYSQRPGYDYFDTWASPSHISTIKVVMALAAIDGMHLRSADISHAFINSPIDCEIYMEQPPGFVEKGPNGEKLVCALDKSIYGLKQSPRLWGVVLRKVLESMGFKKIYSDPSLAIYDKEGI
ncbi:hypothetical protein ONZ45_g7425 [Pleurotus djamor]|nr:hypothetical protein ONZ45_g7425 [Pleurotus djamor]